MCQKQILMKWYKVENLVYQDVKFYTFEFSNEMWNVLDILCSFIDSFIQKNRDNFRVYLERAHQAFLTT